MHGPGGGALLQAVLGGFFGALGQGRALGGGVHAGGGGVRAGRGRLRGRDVAGGVVVGLGWHVAPLCVRP